jgi:hypothetical protein
MVTLYSSASAKFYRFIPHFRKVRTTRSCAGAERAVTKAVRMGESSSENCAWIDCSASKNPLNGPPGSGVLIPACVFLIQSITLSWILPAQRLLAG